MPSNPVMKYLLFNLLFLFVLKTSAQNISGLYNGTLTNDSLKMVQNYQLALSEYRGKITGYSYTTFVSNDTFYYGIKRIRAIKKDGQLVVEDVEMLINNYPKRPDKGVHVTNTIPLPQQDTIIDLNGKWETNKTKRFYAIGGELKLKRDNDSANSALINHLKELNVISYQDEPVVVKKDTPQKQAVPKKKPDAETKEIQIVQVKVESKTPAEIVINPLNRKENIIQTVSVQSDSLVLAFYDNGVVDGDTISVYLDDQNIISKSKLIGLAAKKVVYLNGANTNEFKLTLIAENLGTIPPNTGLVIVQDGIQKFEIRFSADLQNNAAIVFRKKTP